MRWRMILWAVGIAVIAAIGAIAVAVVSFDPESQKPRIIEAVKQATGRDVLLQGRIGLALSLRPTIEVRDVALLNPPGFSRPEMATVRKVDLQLALLPLLHRRIEIDRLIVTQPDIRLETDAKGRPNWLFAPARPAAAPAAPAVAGTGKSTPMAVAIRDLRLDDGRFSYRDGVTGRLVAVAVKQIATRTVSLDAPLHVTAAFAVDGSEIALTAETGPLDRLTGSATAQPWPLRLAITAAGAKLDISGAVADPPAMRGLQLALTGDIPDLGALAAVAKLTLPPVKALKATAVLRDDPQGPATGMTLRDLKVTSAAGDLAGDITVAFRPALALSGTLKSARIDADSLMQPVAAASSRTTAVTAAEPAAGKAKWLIPDWPLPFEQLKALAADLHVAIGTLRFDGADTKAISAHVLLRDGVLTLDPASADLPQGHVALTLTADARKAAPPVHLTLRAPGLALQPLLAALHEPAYATGNLEVQADLTGNGESPHAIASSLGGHLGLALADGTIDSKLVGGAMATILRAVNPSAGSANASALRCFALRLDFVKGTGTVRALALGAPNINLDGGGSVDLASETLALNLRSRALVGRMAVAAPVQVTGPLAAPRTKVDSLEIAQSNAAVLGALLGGTKLPADGGGDVCPAALAIARGLAPPPAEAAPAPAPVQGAAPAAKPPDAGQLLKQLFR